MATDPELDKTIRKNALSSGLILGAASFVLGILSFYYMTSMATSFWSAVLGPILIGMVGSIVIAVFVILDLRKKIGGYWAFKQATTGIFIAFFVSFILSSILTNFVFAKLVEPQMAEKVQAVVVDGTTKMMEKSNVEQDKIDATVEKMQKDFDEKQNASFGKKALSFGGSILLTFVLSLIFGAIFKKERPLFEATDLDQETV